MSGPSITLQGLDDAQKQMERIERGTRGLANYRGYVFSRRPYAYGIETGFHRVSGKLAREAGGTQSFERAVASVMSGADADLSAGLTKVTAPGKWVLKRLALWARRLIRADVPRESGRLRRSIRAEVRQGEL